MTTDVQEAIPSKVSEIFQATERLAAVERLTLAKLLLDSVLADEQEAKADADWSAMGLAAFQRDWDQEKDTEFEEWDESEWLQAAARNPAFRFLKEPEEDIYSLEDGKPFHDQA